MIYDLTTLLSTIVAASASFVAILGGFIASKLISISSERNGVLKRLQDIDEEISYRNAVLNNAREQNNQEDALYFVLDNIEALIYDNELERVYDEEKTNIELYDLVPFCEKSKDIYKQYCSVIEDNPSLNSDYVPERIAEELYEDAFGYEVCGRIGLYFHIQNKKQYNGFFKPQLAKASYLRPAIQALYVRNVETIANENREIEWLKIQRKQCEETRRILQRPKGMKNGLLVFAIFSVLCIIAPLFFSPFKTMDYDYFIMVKYAFIVIFACGITSIFLYLVWLLKWVPDGEMLNERAE